MSDQAKERRRNEIPTLNTDHLKRKWLNLPYCSDSPAQKLDIYLPPASEGPFPIILAIHGGAFLSGDKADIQLAPMLEGLNKTVCRCLR